MPREDDDDLFHDEDDVDFDDEQAAEDSDEEQAEAKAKKKKTAKKKSATKKTAKKKAAKKKAAKKSPKKKAKAPRKKVADDGFAAGLDLEESNGAADSAVEDQEPPQDEDVKQTGAEKAGGEKTGGDASETDADEYGRPEPQSDHMVHLYDLGRLKRTLDREFTAEEAHAFADRYSKVSKNYGRKAVAGKKDTQPAKVID